MALMRLLNRFVRDCLDPVEGKYHYGKLKKGQRTQTGHLTELLLQSVVEQGRCDAADFCARWDGILSRIDGNVPVGIMGGPQRTCVACTRTAS
jgi:hypothetical protein